jgi:hypothetical protein
MVTIMDLRNSCDSSLLSWRRWCGWRLRATVRSGPLFAVLLMASGCAQLSEPSLGPAEKPGDLGPLDSVYDRSKWTWVKNVDGRVLLSHIGVRQCFIDPTPNDDLNDPAFSVRREVKTIGGTAYEILNVYEKRDFWQAVYFRNGTRSPLLGVYSEGRCREEAERILQAYEKSISKPDQK